MNKIIIFGIVIVIIAALVSWAIHSVNKQAKEGGFEQK